MKIKVQIIIAIINLGSNFNNKVFYYRMSVFVVKEIIATIIAIVNCLINFLN